MKRLPFIAAFLVLALATAMPFVLAARSEAGEQPEPVVYPCPAFGAAIGPGGSVVISEEEYHNGIYPIGRPFVVLRCYR